MAAEKQHRSRDKMLVALEAVLGKDVIRNMAQSWYSTDLHIVILNRISYAQTPEL